MPGTCPGAPPSPCCYGEPILSSCHLPVSQWSFVIPVLWKKGNVFGEARGGVGRRWMPWETVVPVSLEEDQGLKLPSGRIALGGCSKQGRRQKVGSWWILRVCATDQTSLKQGEVGMHPSFPWVTIALSPHPRGCWQGGEPHWGGCCPTAVISISAFISPGRNAFERKLRIVLIILGLCWVSLFKWVIRHRGRIGLCKG